MLLKTDIENNLNSLDTKYINESDGIATLMYAKIALLELCGWTELSMDDLVRRCAKHSLSKQKNIDFIEDPIIKNTYGFDYKVHFRKMFCQIIGLSGFEQIEDAMDPQKLQDLKSALGKLKIVRDKEAHTFIVATRGIDAPSVTKRHLKQVFDGLTEFELQLSNNRYLP